jgi:hypothetical protein
MRVFGLCDVVGGEPGDGFWEMEERGKRERELDGDGDVTL